MKSKVSSWPSVGSTYSRMAREILLLRVPPSQAAISVSAAAAMIIKISLFVMVLRFLRFESVSVLIVRHCKITS